MVSSGDSTEKVPIRSHMLEHLYSLRAMLRHSALIMLADAQCRAIVIRYPEEFGLYFATVETSKSPLA